MQYELRPSSTVGLYSTNERGFRDAPFTTPKPPGVFRILFLGDSIVYGLWVKRENTITEQLEQILAERGSSPTYEVCNLGVSGYNTEQELETYRRKCADLDGDVVLLGWFVNDLVEASAELGALSRFDEDRRAGLISVRSPIFRWSKLAGFLRYRVFGRKLNWGQALTERERPEGDAREQVAHHLTGFARDADSARVFYPKVPDQIARWQSLCESRGARFAFVIMPVLCDWESYPFRDLHARLVATCDSLGVPALDILPTYERVPLEQITTGTPRTRARLATAKPRKPSPHSWNRARFFRRAAKPRCRIPPPNPRLAKSRWALCRSRSPGRVHRAIAAAAKRMRIGSIGAR